MHQGKTVSIVFPAYNEEEGIARAIREFRMMNAVEWVLEHAPVIKHYSAHNVVCARKRG